MSADAAPPFALPSKPATKSAVVFRDPASLPAEFARPVLAIGNFDGVHLGHRAVIAAARALAAPSGAPVVVLTFDPHPRRYFAPDRPMFELSPEPLKSRLLIGAGADGVVVLTFDKSLAETSADDFASNLIFRRFAARGVVVGYDFHYGKGRAGSPATLEEEGRRIGFAVEIVAPVGGEAPHSSTTIRKWLGEGRVREAASGLGGNWCLAAKVEHGDKRGRNLGFPTANLHLDPGCGLAHGIYAVRAACKGGIFEGVASFGRRPTFDNGPPKLEVHLFDFSGDLYGERLIVEFVDFIRSEQQFPDIAALIAAMKNDCEEARVRLACLSGVSPSFLALLAANEPGPR